ncbi:unnamed protein product [Taenia asiatica]|uniref:Ovule protein n=1 Tax=Taenia asiatica TaxID=60517 RepID=A0A0R3W364_TAEAS|nr:unnamed protein product [Taenia asiatica]
MRSTHTVTIYFEKCYCDGVLCILIVTSQQLEDIIHNHPVETFFKRPISVVCINWSTHCKGLSGTSLSIGKTSRHGSLKD